VHKREDAPESVDHLVFLSFILCSFFFILISSKVVLLSLLGGGVEREKFHAADFFPRERRERVIERHAPVIKHFAALPSLVHLLF